MVHSAGGRGLAGAARRILRPARPLGSAAYSSSSLQAPKDPQGAGLTLEAWERADQETHFL